MSDISLLPEQYREKEEELKKAQPPAENAEETVMHVPQELKEDVEVIEVEEGEVEQVLSGEPLLTRLIYKAGLWLETARDRLFKPRIPEPPAKMPPQFFKPAPAVRPTLKPPAAPPPPLKPVQPPSAAQPLKPEAAAALPPAVTPPPAATPAVPSRARIIPSGATPRRVRIIKRVHKPVHVSLLDEDLVRQLQINIPKRAFTLAFLTIFFAAVFTASFFLLDKQQVQAAAAERVARQELEALRGQITDLQSQWSAFQDLEPRLMAFNDLMDRHISVRHALKFLEQRTLSDVSYAGFMMDSGGQVHLAVTAPTFEAAAKQLQIFKDSPEVKAVDATAFGYAAAAANKSAGVSFQLTVQFQNQALLFEKPLAER